MQRALMWLNLYGRQAKQVENAFFVFFACFRHYVRQPDNHIGWATSMPFTSIYSIDLRTNTWNFCDKTLRIGGFEKLSFFESAILDFFFKKIFFLLHPHENQSKFLRQQGWVEILMITLVSSPKQHLRKHMQHSVSRS
jgi:hypothetical protein